MRRSALVLVGLLVSVASLVLLARSVDLAATGLTLAHASGGPLLAAIAVAFAGICVRMLIWRRLLPDRLDQTRVSIGRLAPVLLVGYLGNAVLPARLGEIVRAYLISRRENVELGGALGSIALERIIDTSSLAVVAFIAAIGSGAAGWIVQGTGILAVIGTCVIAALATIGLQPTVRQLGRLGAIGPLREPIAALVRRLEPFVYWSGGAHRRGAMATAIGLSLSAWALNAVMFYLAALAVGASVTPAGALLIMAVSVLATAIPSAPAYVGTFELAVVTIGSSIGVPRDAALAIAILAHGLGLLPTAIGGPIALASLGGGLRGMSAAAIEERRLRSDSGPVREGSGNNP